MSIIKILQCGALSPVHGGIESFIYNNWRHLDKEKFKYDFLVTNKDRSVIYENELRENNVRIYHEWVGRKKSILIHYIKLFNFFANHKYDVVVCNLLDLSNLDCLIIAWLFNVKIRIVHSHKALKFEKSGIIRNVLKKINQVIVASLATHMFACSDDAGKWMFGNVWLKSIGVKSFVINNGIDTTRYKFNKKIRSSKRRELNLEDKIIIGHTGRLAYPKNQMFIIDVFKELCKIHLNLHLLLVGEGSLRSDIEMKIDSLNLTDKVTLLGEREDISDLLQAMDVFIFPSEWEGLGISLIEAESVGLKCVISDNIPREAILTDNVSVLSLKENIETWRKALENNFLYERNDCSEVVRNKGYDAKTSSQKYQAIILNSFYSK